MRILSYRIKNDNLIVEALDPQHPARESYRQPNQAWAALRQWYKRDNDALRKDGWRVKLDVDEKQLAVEAAVVAIDHAPIPGIFRRLLGGLFGKRG